MARTYREKLSADNEIRQARYRAERDIGPLPPVKDVRKRRQAKKSLLYFLKNFQLK